MPSATPSESGSFASAASGGLGFGLYVRLSFMMFLQYFVWGIWLPVLFGYADELKFSKLQFGIITTVYGFGSIFGPMIVGQFADRYFATEKVLFFCHLVGGFLLILGGNLTTFTPLFLTLFIYCCLYMPTMGLTNSLTFRALGEGNQNSFPNIRLWGTLGWIAAGVSFAMYLDYKNLTLLRDICGFIGLAGVFETFFGWWSATVIPWFENTLFPRIGEPASRDCLRVAGAASILYALYCLTLPHTPPVPAKDTDPLDKRSAALRSLELMRNRSFAVLVVVAGLTGIMLAFYFTCEYPFLTHLSDQRFAETGVRPYEPSQNGAIMTLGQISELLLMTLVPLSVAKFGIKKTMILGALAWAARFGLSAHGSPLWLMITTIAFHGFAFGFFFVPAQMYVDRSAGPDIKASAQSLLIFVIYGMGTVLGSFIAGAVMEYFGDDWFRIWIGPCVLTCVCIAVFVALFREDEVIRAADAGSEPEPKPAA